MTENNRLEYDRKYYQENKDKINARRRENRYLKNQENPRTYKTERIQCECGGIWSKHQGFPRHGKTMKHQSYLNSLS